VADTTHAAALDYAGRGWPVVPLWWPLRPGRCACGADECASPGKHPHAGHARHGLEDATTDATVVDAWWTATPELNVGLRTGVAFDVLDLDDPGAGGWLARYADERGEDTDECWAWGPMSITAHGHHLLYAATGAGNRARVHGVAGFDWRGAGGYVVAPPSRHETGHVYAWHPDCGPDAPIPMAPAFLVELVTHRAEQPASLPLEQRLRPLTAPGGWSPSGLVARVATAAAGERNSVLNWAANRVGLDVRAGAAPSAVAVAALDDLALAATRAGLATLEVERTIASGFRAGVDGRGA